MSVSEVLQVSAQVGRNGLPLNVMQPWPRGHGRQDSDPVAGTCGYDAWLAERSDFDRPNRSIELKIRERAASDLRPRVRSDPPSPALGYARAQYLRRCLLRRIARGIAVLQRLDRRGAARCVIGYLFATLVPFVVLAPLVGPLIDRFGRARRLVAASTCLGRGILCLFVSGDLRNLLLYPEAFGILVLEKGYSVTKSALVPTLVDRDADLVGANSQLSRISTVAGLVGGAIAVGVLTLGNASQVLRIAALVYFTAAGLALRIPPDDGVRLPPDSARTCGASLPRDPVRGVRNGRVTRRDRLPRVPRCVRGSSARVRRPGSSR